MEFVQDVVTVIYVQWRITYRHREVLTSQSSPQDWLESGMLLECMEFGVGNLNRGWTESYPFYFPSLSWLEVSMC